MISSLYFPMKKASRRDVLGFSPPSLPTPRVLLNLPSPSSMKYKSMSLVSASLAHSTKKIFLTANAPSSFVIIKTTVQYFPVFLVHGSGSCAGTRSVTAPSRRTLNTTLDNAQTAHPPVHILALYLFLMFSDSILKSPRNPTHSTYKHFPPTALNEQHKEPLAPPHERIRLGRKTPSHYQIKEAQTPS